MGGAPCPGHGCGRQGPAASPEKEEPERLRKLFCAQPLTVMSLTTDLTPRVSWAILLTSDFSASESATPVTVTTPFSVMTLVAMALVERWLRSENLTCEVIDAS